MMSCLHGMTMRMHELIMSYKCDYQAVRRLSQLEPQLKPFNFTIHMSGYLGLHLGVGLLYIDTIYVQQTET
jgi:hypothetical protein